MIRNAKHLSFKKRLFSIETGTEQIQLQGSAFPGRETVVLYRAFNITRQNAVLGRFAFECVN
eukprot:7999876-Heterocapsa_arctica.AAC.1